MSNSPDQKPVDLQKDADGKSSRRVFLGSILSGFLATTLGAEKHRDMRQATGKEALDALLGQNIADPAELEQKLNALLHDLDDVDDETKAQLRKILDTYQEKDPVAYQKLISKIDTKNEHEGSTWVDWAGTGVFVHGVADLMKQGHVSSGPYLELAAIWVIKLLLSKPKERHHLLDELKTNAILIPAILFLVTAGENMTFDVGIFQEEIKKRMSGAMVEKQKKNILERGLKAKKKIEQFQKALLGELQGKWFKKDVGTTMKGLMKNREFSEDEDTKNTIEHFVKTELGVEMQVAYLNQKSKDKETKENDFKKAWLQDNLPNLTARVTDRFTNAEKIDEIFTYGSGMTVFPAATSPVATTVATSVIANVSGITNKVVGTNTESFPEGFKHYGLKNPGLIPPFSTRIQALMEDFVANLSGLGGVGDPPFLAMLMTFGLKGLLAQTIATLPATALNAELSYKAILKEYFPYLGDVEAHQLATSHMAKLMPTYLKLFAANVANVIGALIEATLMNWKGAALAGGVVGHVMGVGADKGAVTAGGFILIMEKLGLKEMIEKKLGPASTWRFKSGVQFSLPHMVFEALDELAIIEKPNPQNLTAYFEKLQEILATHIEKVVTTAGEEKKSPASAVPSPESQIGPEWSEKLKLLNSHFEELWSLSTEPAEIRDLVAQIEVLKKRRAETVDPMERAQLTTDIHALTQMKTPMGQTSGAKAERNRLTKDFTSKRDEVNKEIKDLENLAKNVKDKNIRRQIFFCLAEARKKIVRLELSQIGFFNLEGEKNPLAYFSRLSEKFDIEHLQALLGHRRTEVINVLPFQAHCVPFLTAVFKEVLQLVPQDIRPVMAFLLYVLLNIFSSGADNLVASLVGLGIDPSLWPFIQMASIDGGKNSRIANMANLAGCSLEDFPLNVSLCLYLLSQRMQKAGINLGYAYLIDIVSRKLSIELKPLNDQEAHAHLEALNSRKSPEDKSLDAEGLIESFNRRIKDFFGRSGNDAKAA